MRRAELLVNVIRRLSENVQVGASDGISQIEMVHFITSAQERLVSRIHKTNNKLLTKEHKVTPVSGQEEYDLPFDIFTDSHIVDLVWTKTGNARDYISLEKVGFKERFQEVGDPTRYMPFPFPRKILGSPSKSNLGSEGALLSPASMQGEIQVRW